jgi:Major Facilitator Superfamily
MRSRSGSASSLSRRTRGSALAWLLTVSDLVNSDSTIQRPVNYHRTFRATVAASLPPPGPLRRIGWGTFVSGIGNGAWYASWAIFLTESVGLSPLQVGVGMTVAGAVALVLATPIGYLADQHGPREIFIGVLLLQTLGSLAYVGVHSFISYLAVAALTSLSAGGARNALVTGLATEAEARAALASLRVQSHVAWAIGAGIGALVIALDTRPAYVALLGLNAVTYAGYAALLLGVPRVAPIPRLRGTRRFTVIHDRPYMSLAGLVGTLALCWAMLSSGLPLWVVRHTDAPQSIAAIVVVMNSLAIAAFQIRVTRGIESPHAAARGAAISGGSLALACVAFALTGGWGGWTAVTVLLLGGALHTVGELFFVASSWGLSIPLMPRHAHGEYQGMFATGEATALLAAPVLMTTLVGDWGRPGWIVLALLFIAVSALTTPATHWALRTRPYPLT